MDFQIAVDNLNRLDDIELEAFRTLGRVLADIPAEDGIENFYQEHLGDRVDQTFDYFTYSAIAPIAYYITQLVDGEPVSYKPIRYKRYITGSNSYRLISHGIFILPDFKHSNGPVGISLTVGPNHFSLGISVDAHQDSATEVVAAVIKAATENSFHKGKVLLCSATQMGIEVEHIEPDHASRESLFYEDKIWQAIDYNMSVLYDKNQILKDLDLGTRRGILLAGPPGTGKSALSTTIINEREEDVTAFVVNPECAVQQLRAVYDMAAAFGKSIVVLEDIDLYLSNRQISGAKMALSEFLNILDGTAKYNDVVTIGTTNDPEALDAAAVRSARFDVLLEVGYPNKEAKVSILTKYLSSRSDGVDTRALVNLMPPDVTGADIREMIRYTVLAEGELTTDTIRNTIKAGRWKPAVSAGFFL